MCDFGLPKYYFGKLLSIFKKVSKGFNLVLSLVVYQINTNNTNYELK